MRPKILLTFLFFIIVQFCFGQNEWAPIGAKWYYTLKFASTNAEDFNIMESMKDTVINTITCKKILRLNITCDDRPQIEFMYEDSNRVYFYDEYSNKFNLLYDFNKTPGETWYIQVNDNSNNPDSLLVHVDSISTIIINGIPLKVLYTTIGSTTNWVGYSGKITEKLGHDRNMFPFINSACDLNFNNGLRCYEDSLLGNYQTGIAPICDYTNVGIAEIFSVADFNLHPNPVLDYLYFNNLKHDQLIVNIYNIFGEIVKSCITNSDKINLQYLTKGFYIITFSSLDNKIIHISTFLK